MSEDESKTADGPPVEVLIVDNDKAHAEAVADALDRPGFHCRIATSGAEGARWIDEAASVFDVIVTDLVMHDVDGLDILNRAKSAQPDAEVILMTGHGTIPSAVEAMQQGSVQLPAQTARHQRSFGRSPKRRPRVSRLASGQRRVEAAARRKIRLRGRHRRQPPDARRDRTAQTHRPDQRHVC